MAEVTYISVVWTAGDTMTEAKLDNMVANDRAVDAMAQGVEFAERASPSTPGANKLHVYGKDKAGLATLYMINDNGDDLEISERHSVFTFTYPDTMRVDTSVSPVLIVTRAMEIEKAYAAVKTAPVGADLIFDINKNASTIWATQGDRLKITDGNTSGNETDFDTTSLAEGDILTLDVDQVGSSTAGADATIELKCK